MKRKFVWCLVIIALLIALVISANIITDLNNKYADFKNDMSTLSGVKFGDSQQEILYSFGKPDMVRKDDNNSTPSLSPAFELKEGDSVDNYLIWDYFSNNKVYLTIEFSAQSKTASHISCTLIDPNAPLSLCRTLFGISPGTNPNLVNVYYNSSEDNVISHLGKPDRESYRTVNGLNQKLLTYDHLGLTFIMIGKLVYSIHKYDTDPDFTWWLFNMPH